MKGSGTSKPSTASSVKGLFPPAEKIPAAPGAKPPANTAPWTRWVEGDGSRSFDDSCWSPSESAKLRRAAFTKRRGGSSGSTVKSAGSRGGSSVQAADSPSHPAGKKSPAAAGKMSPAAAEKKQDFYRRRTSTLATQGGEQSPRNSDPFNPKLMRRGSSSLCEGFFTKTVAERPTWLVNRKLDKRAVSDKDSDTSRSRSGSQRHLALSVALDCAYAASTGRALPEIDDGYEVPSFDVSGLTDVSDRPVGIGCQGTVWSCAVPKGKFSGRRLALKVLRGDLAADPTECESFVREALLLGRMKHTHVLKALGCSETTAGLPCLLLAWCETDASRALRLDEVGSDSSTRAAVRKAWPSGERLRLLRELALALEFIHSGDAIAGGVAVVHRDLKPDNFGIDSNRQLKLLDFGLAVALETEQGNTSATYELTGATGSRRYMAPEVCRRDLYGTKVDVYSWAIAAFEIWSLAGKPYRRHDVKSHGEHVVRGGERPLIPGNWDPDLSDVLRRAWQDDQEARPTAGDICGTLYRLSLSMHAVPPPDPFPSGRKEKKGGGGGFCLPKLRRGSA